MTDQNVIFWSYFRTKHGFSLLIELHYLFSSRLSNKRCTLLTQFIFKKSIRRESHAKTVSERKNTFVIVFKGSCSTYEDHQLMKKQLLRHFLTPSLILSCNIQYFSLWILKTVSLHIILIVITLLIAIMRNFCLVFFSILVVVWDWVDNVETKWVVHTD